MQLFKKKKRVKQSNSAALQFCFNFHSKSTWNLVHISPILTLMLLAISLHMSSLSFPCYCFLVATGYTGVVYWISLGCWWWWVSSSKKWSPRNGFMTTSKSSSVFQEDTISSTCQTGWHFKLWTITCMRFLGVGCGWGLIEEIHECFPEPWKSFGNHWKKQVSITRWSKLSCFAKLTSDVVVVIVVLDH